MFGFKKKYLDLKLGSAETQFIRIIERPGLWMTAQESHEILQDLKTVVRALDIGDLQYGLFLGKKEAFDNAVLTIIYDGTSRRPVAFNALALMDCSFKGQNINVLHLGLVVVDPNYRAKGMSWILYGLTTFLIFMKNSCRPIWVSNVSQVPAILGAVSEGFANVFPDPAHHSRRTYEHLLLAREIMARHRHVFGVGPEAEFDEENFIIRRAYTGGSEGLKKTFAEAPKHRLGVFNDFAHSHLDYERGDDFLQIAMVDVSCYYRYVLHQVPRASRLTLLTKVFFAFFEFGIAPIFQWFAAGNQKAHLRPRAGWFL